MIREDALVRRRWRLAAIVSLAAVLFLPAVWGRDPWDPDEPRYAEVTRQMALHGDLLVPHFNGEIYSEKPPLFFWLSLAAEGIPGVPPGSGGRLVGIIASAGTLLLTWRIGALLMGEAAGTMAAVLLSGCLLFWHLASSGVIDPLLGFLVTLALYGFARRVRERKGGLLVFYGACSMAVLAKGPVGLLVPALTALAFTAINGGWRALRAWHPCWGVPLAAAPTLAWLALAAQRAGPEYLDTMLFRQNLGRAMNAYVHQQPFWYYAAVIPLVLMPLTLVLPQSLVAAWRERVCGVRPMLLPLTWFGSTFVFFTLLSSKKTRYMMVLTPAVALLAAGWAMRRLFPPEGRIGAGRGVLVAGAAAGSGLSALLLAAALAGPVALPSLVRDGLRGPENHEALAAIEGAITWPGSWRVILPAALLGASCAAGLSLSVRRRPEALPTLLAGWLAFLAIGGALWTPLADPVKSARGLASLVRETGGHGPVYVLDDNHPAGLNFYLEQDRLPFLKTKTERLLASEEAGALFVGSAEVMGRVESRTGIRFVNRTCRRLGSVVTCVASALPPPL